MEDLSFQRRDWGKIGPRITHGSIRNRILPNIYRKIFSCIRSFTISPTLVDTGNLILSCSIFYICRVTWRLKCTHQVGVLSYKCLQTANIFIALLLQLKTQPCLKPVLHVWDLAYSEQWRRQRPPAPCSGPITARDT